MKILYKIYSIQTAPQQIQSTETYYSGYTNSVETSYSENIKILVEYDGNLYPSIDEAIKHISDTDVYGNELTILPIVTK
jgi:uncharacterized protein YfbU (UPF0304 family)